jgi:Transposase DDE domain
VAFVCPTSCHAGGLPVRAGAARVGYSKLLKNGVIEGSHSPFDGGRLGRFSQISPLAAGTLEQAAEVVRLYRLRWRVEQTFRMLKSDGLKLDECQTYTAWRLFNLAALHSMERSDHSVVDARDGSGRPASDVANQAEITVAEAIGPTLAGRTARQRNPHPNAAWPV